MAKPQLGKQKNSWIVISSGFPIFFVYFHCAANFFFLCTAQNSCDTRFSFNANIWIGR